jgi:hypothetical protein
VDLQQVNNMVLDPKKSYTPTPSKFQTLWELANKLYGEYIDFDKQLTILENRMNENSNKITDVSSNVRNT